MPISNNFRRPQGRSVQPLWLRLALAGTLLTLLACPTLAASLQWIGVEPLMVGIDTDTGDLAAVRYRGETLAAGNAEGTLYDLRLDDQWQHTRGALKPKLAGVKQADARTWVVSITSKPWRLDFRYRFAGDAAELNRSVRIRYDGDDTPKLKGFWMAYPPLPVGPSACYFSPGHYPPQSYTGADLKPGVNRSFGQSSAPLVLELGPQRSLVWLLDESTPVSDRGSVSVRELAGAVRISQSFSVAARMKAGAEQEMGQASCYVVEGNAEAALRSIHAWMRRHGQTTPAGRPDWFRCAVLYSYHPGGTIGSQFRDLGGFEPATKLLDAIANLGANSVWIMPIEDASVYHPRDYYQFQPGLGTPDDYRRLVARAHALNLHVLQDCVPHGGRNSYPRAKQHPEWLAYNEDGSTLDYWCYDFNWPTWRKYMAEVARHYMTQYDIDGFRVDAVGGSRIPNWNPEIPYARASFAQMQGGLNMLRDLRAAVKSAKPEAGGLLAEVQGSIYGTAGDAIYDFTACYQAFHDLRRLPPDEFVVRLRRWLHEQQHAEVPDLIRLRHVESHDSLRSELWYGVQPSRAMFALSAWIHGMPLIYHEMELGNRAVIQRILAIRQSLPELCGGSADYQCIEAPAGVFACLRQEGSNASFVLVNLNPQATDAAIAVPVESLPDKHRTDLTLTDLWRGQSLSPVVTGSRLTFQVPLPPFGFTVCAARTGSRPSLPTTPQLPPASAPTAPITTPGEAPLAELSHGNWQATVGRNGLLQSYRIGGQPIVGPLDLFLPAALRSDRAATVVESSPGLVRCRLPIGGGLEVAYRTDGMGRLEISAHWPNGAPRDSRIYLPVIDARRWYARTTEGVLEDEYRPRHLTTDSARGNIYWRSQGTNVIYDSALRPICLGRTSGALGAVAVAGPMTLDFPDRPERVQWTDRIGPNQQLGAFLWWNNTEVPGGASNRLCVALGHAAPPDPIASSVAPVEWKNLGAWRLAAGGWEFENPHYRVRLSRQGTLSGLWTKQNGVETEVVRRADIYTDYGFGKERERYSASDDVEVATRLWVESDNAKPRLHAVFQGRLRGSQRFELIQPPVEYFCEYVFDGGASFRASSGIRPPTTAADAKAFLSAIVSLPSATRFAYFRQGVLLKGDRIAAGSTRNWQTKTGGQGLPDRIELHNEAGRLLALDELRYGGQPPINVFLQNTQLFLAWCDASPVSAQGATTWSWQSAVWTPGDRTPNAVGAPPRFAEATPRAILSDGDFESLAIATVVSQRTGQPLPGGDAVSAWRLPDGARLVAQPVHQGTAALEIVNTTGEYLLARQPIPGTALAAGTRWRLSAWVKAEDIRAGDASWKVGVLRFAVAAPKVSYISSPSLLGTFDWRKVSVEISVPPGAAVQAEAGLNGATGKMWVDDVVLEQLP